MRARIRKRILLLSAILLALGVAMTYAGTNPPGPGTANSPGSFNDPNGSLTMTQLLPFHPYNASDNAQTHTITFDVLGIEGSQPPAGVVFSVATTGSLTANFIGSKPQVICAHCSSSYAGVTETITYSGAVSDTLTVIWTALTGILAEPGGQTQMFLDNFQYQNPELMTSWTIDQYRTSPSGIYTEGGYLTMSAKIASAIETARVNSPLAYSTGYGYASNTLIKRKLTVALIPFAAKVTPNTAYVQAGFASLISSGTFPGNTPAGTADTNFNNDCASRQSSIELVQMKNDGSVLVAACGDMASTGYSTLESGLDPTLYTVFTIETSGVYCSVCIDNALIGSQWVYFRVYQDDSTGKLLQSTDKSINFTSSIAPLFKSSYIFVSQFQSDSAASSETSRINVVQLQNYGSPVCLGCVPPTYPTPSNCTGPILCGLAVLASWLGGGDLSIGWTFVAFIFIGFTVGVTVMVTRNLIPTSTVGMLTIGAFYYGGVVPTWIIFLILLTFGCFLGWGILKRLLGGSWSGQSGGGSPVEEPVE